MISRIEVSMNGYGVFFQTTHIEMLRILMGAYVDGLEFQQMEEICLFAACYICHMCHMYHQSVKSRKGVG